VISDEKSAGVYECFPFSWPYNARSVEVGSPNSPEVLLWEVSKVVRDVDAAATSNSNKV
jgi:hypothetical protein